MAVLATIYLKVPAALIPSTLNNFVHKVNLSTLPAEFWGNIDAAGAYIRVKDAAGSDLPFDLIYIDTATDRGVLFFRGTLTAGSINEYQIVVNNSVAAPAVTDPLGRNAVWSDYDCFFVGSAPGTNRTGAATTQSNLTAGTSYAYGYEPLSPVVEVHQGVAFDGTHYYVTDDNLIRKYDLEWNVIAENAAPLTAMRAASGFVSLNHIGDCTIKGGELFAVVEEYPNAPTYDTQIIAVINISDLSLNRVYNISAQAHEVSSICWDATNGYFVITDYTTAGNSLLHKYSAVGAYLGTIATASITQKQGIEYYGGHFYISRGTQTLHRLNLDGTGLITLCAGAPTSQMEGLCSLGDGSFAVLFDGLPSALWRAVPVAEWSARYPTWLNMMNSGPFRSVGLPKRTVWTIGASVIPVIDGGTRSITSYSDNSTSNANRSSAGMRSATTYGMWNSTDVWLDSDSRKLNNLPSNVGSRARIHQRFNGTTDRTLWRQGDLEATDLGTSQRPAGTGDTLFVGTEDTDLNERFVGLLNFVYLRNGLLSADWIKTEFYSWESETMFGVGVVAQADADFVELNVTIGTDTDPSSGAASWTKMPGMSNYTTRNRSVVVNPAFGARFFSADTPRQTSAYQDIDVSAYDDRIDNGDVLAALTASIVSDHITPSNQDDRGWYELRFYDGSNVEIKRTKTRPRATALGVWTPANLKVPVPAGTRTVRLHLEAWRTNGSDLNICWDIDSLTLYGPLLGTPPDPSRRRNASMLLG